MNEKLGQALGICSGSCNHTRCRIFRKFGIDQDWVPFMKIVMNWGEIDDVYEVEHVVIDPDGTVWSVGGSVFVKQPHGYSHVALRNRRLIVPEEVTS